MSTKSTAVLLALSLFLAGYFGSKVYKKHFAHENETQGFLDRSKSLDLELEVVDIGRCDDGAVCIFTTLKGQTVVVTANDGRIVGSKDNDLINLDKTIEDPINCPLVIYNNKMLDK